MTGGWRHTCKAGFQRKRLTIRNLGYTADELTIRLRSADFGTPDEWLTRTKTDLVFAFFGYNESFGDLNRFRKALSRLHHAYTRTEIQRHECASAGALLTHRP